MRVFLFRAEILQKISFAFWAMEFQKNCFWDFLTFRDEFLEPKKTLLTLHEFKIAIHVAEEAFKNGTASTYPQPEDLKTFIENQLYNYEYENVVSIAPRYSWNIWKNICLRNLSHQLNFDNKSCSPVPVPSVMSKNILKPDGLKALTNTQRLEVHFILIFKKKIFKKCL